MPALTRMGWPCLVVGKMVILEALLVIKNVDIETPCAGLVWLWENSHFQTHEIFGLLLLF